MKNFSEVYETIPGNGWLSKVEAQLLWDAAICTSGPILEVGSFQGRSTVLLAALGRPVYAVDPFDDFSSELSGDEIHRRLQENLVSRGISNVQIFRQKIEDWDWQPIGFAYLDGDHTYQGTLSQIRKALACQATGIAIHDVNDTGGGAEVKRAALEYLGPWLQRVERLAVWGLP